MSADQTFTPSAQGTRMTFSTTPNGTTSLIERMRIDNTGFVGIGTVDPLKRVHVSGGRGTILYIIFKFLNYNLSHTFRSPAQKRVLFENHLQVVELFIMEIMA
ncbi:MAG: hypothetical protein U5M51_05705 [Emticicia sp.]|nr:hypothetical protein [Emticicia sp.]